MSIHDAMKDACAAVGIQPPRKTMPGRWIASPVVGKSPANTSGRVLIHDDGQGGKPASRRPAASVIRTPSAAPKPSGRRSRTSPPPSSAGVSRPRTPISLARASRTSSAWSWTIRGR